VFLVAVIVWCRELNQGDSWFHYHTHRQIYYVRFECKMDGDIDYVLQDIFLKNSFLLHAAMHGCDPRPMKLFIEIHVRNDDYRKWVQ